ncbi:ABC transporter [Lysobacter alkalisoli]|uniref:ABC transporter n=2 Tax=Marilutibacter alkalisoli TaxID=2591633 RepID=A0A514BY08_9GAMM|nr:ABC transporter [Lysobacter alkalisoli]
MGIEPDPRSALLLPTLLLALLVLPACSILGNAGPREASVRYAPAPRVLPDPGWPRADWQLSIADPEVSTGFDSLRIAVRPQSNELQVYQGARWARPPGSMVLDSVLQALEDSGRIDAVARQSSGIGADYKLVMDLRRFESDYAGATLPSAVVEISAKLLHVRDQQVAASRVFLQSVPAASPAMADVVTAFEQALAANSREMVGWVLESGNAHELSAHR